MPWHRVINARGEVSLRAEPGREGLQQAMLVAEGVVFAGGRTDLDRYQWDPDVAPGRGARRRRSV